MSLTKCVNGLQVAMSPEEEAATLAEWATHDPAKVAATPKPPTLEDKVNALLQQAALSPTATPEIKALAAPR